MGALQVLVQHLDRLVPELGDPDMDIGAKN